MTTAAAKPRAIGGHHRPVRGLSCEWFTPKAWVDALGPFDLDPCTSRDRPWDTAEFHVTKEDDPDGLSYRWPTSMLTFVNPPYGPEVERWVAKLADHGNGIALVMARTETRWFQGHIWGRASAVLFPRGRPHFCRADGTPARANSGAPVALVAYGNGAVSRLYGSGIAGAIVPVPRG